MSQDDKLLEEHIKRGKALIDKEQSVPLYPALVTSTSDPDAKMYRLKKIEEIKLQIVKEREGREKSYKKIKRWMDAIGYLETGTLGLGAIAAGVGIPAILGIITAPVGLSLEGVFIGAFAFEVLLKFANKKLNLKLKKHDKIRILADAKLNTIDEYVSQAITDGDISHEEFTLINSELKKFNDLKERIRSKTSTQLEKHRTDADFEKEIEKRVSERLAKEKKDLIQKLAGSS